jgi:hypothetical protein
VKTDTVWSAPVGVALMGFSDSVMGDVICFVHSVWHENPSSLLLTDPDPCPVNVILRLTNPAPVKRAVAGWPAADATVRVAELLPNALGANRRVTLHD